MDYNSKTRYTTELGAYVGLIGAQYTHPCTCAPHFHARMHMHTHILHTTPRCFHGFLNLPSSLPGRGGLQFHTFCSCVLSGSGPGPFFVTKNKRPSSCSYIRPFHFDVRVQQAKPAHESHGLTVIGVFLFFLRGPRV